MFMSIVISTKGRGPQVLKLTNKLIETINRDDVEIILGAYPDESNISIVEFIKDMKNVRIEWSEERVFPTYNMCAGLSSGDFLAAIDDDCWPKDDWFEQIEKTISGVRDKDYTYIKIQSDTNPYWAERAVASRKFLKDITGGVICIPHYYSQYTDVEMSDRAIINDCFIESDAYLDHLHWSHGKAAMDDTYREGGAKYAGIDQGIYLDRRRNGFPNNYKACIT